MEYLSVVDCPSELMPGVVYVLKKMSTGRRTEFRLATASVLEELRVAREPIEVMVSELNQAPKDQRESLSNKIRDIQFMIWNDIMVPKYYPAVIRWGLDSVKDLVIDGQPATAESIITRAPEEVTIELGDSIEKVSRLSYEDQILFKLPSTFSAQVDGQTKNSDAPTVEVKPISSISEEIVASTIRT